MKHTKLSRSVFHSIRVAVVCGFACAVILREGSAHAEERAGAQTRYLDRDTAYVFEDDPLDGTAFGDDSTRLRVRARGTRSVLLRPRVHFVRELLKSAEAI